MKYRSDMTYQEMCEYLRVMEWEIELTTFALDILESSEMF